MRQRDRVAIEDAAHPVLSKACSLRTEPRILRHWRAGQNRDFVNILLKCPAYE